MIRYVSICFLLLVLGGCAKPDFTTVEGQSLQLADLQKKPLIVNYWATWCAPCIKEIPELNELAIEHADSLNLVGVNFDQPEGDEAIKQKQKMKISFPVIAGNPAEKLGISIPEVLPTTYVFAAGGELKATLVGPQTGEDLLSVLSGID